MKRLIVAFAAAGFVAGTLFAAGPALADEKAGEGAAMEKMEKKEMKEEKKEVKKAAKAMKWEMNAEKSMGLGPGLARQLMTEEEWEEHRKKMTSMTKEEREKYRNEVHQQLMERAKEKGITMPAEPGPHGKGMDMKKKDMMDRMERPPMGGGMGGGGMGGR